MDFPAVTMPFLEVSEVAKNYPLSTGLWRQIRGGGPVVHALGGVSLKAEEGEAVALVGESGCGKSTLARLLVRLERPTSGRIALAGEDIAELRGTALRAWRRSVQMVFQDPYESLNPRRTVLESVTEPLRYLGLARTVDERRARALDALLQVDLVPAEQFGARLPHQLSGGQRQRVAIARALVVRPTFIVADEPVSMLDVSVRSSVLGVLRRLNRQSGIGLLLITHDIATAVLLCDRVVVMYLGRIVESLPAKALAGHARHPYTQLLISAVPDLRRPWSGRLGDAGEIPSAIALPPGCRFAPRCRLADSRCQREEPAPRPIAPGQQVACHHADRTPAADMPATFRTAPATPLPGG